MIKVFKDLLSEEDVKYLNSVAMQYLNDGTLKLGSYAGRYTTRYPGENFKFEPKVYEISKKVREAAGISEFELETGRGKDGINVAVTLYDGFVDLHVDPRSPKGEATYRCNVITQRSSVGGDLQINGKIVPLNEGDVHGYLVSEIEHIVTASEGSKPRILWMFGCYIPAEKVKYYL